MGHTKGDLIPRGVRGPSPFGTSTFILLRALEPFLLRYILQTSPITTSLLPAFGLSKLASSIPPPPSHGYLTTNDSLVTTFGINLPPFPALLFLMSCAASTKQIFWILSTSKEQMPVGGAIIIATYNAVNNALNTLLFTVASANPTYTLFHPWNMYIGLVLFLTGILIEPIAEVQRKRFKDDPRNEGKLFTGGLFGWARSINYGAYAVWRTGFAVAGGGPVWGLVAASFFIWDFSTRGVPTMEEYCERKYGRQWEEVKRKVPYKLFPGVY